MGEYNFVWKDKEGLVSVGTVSSKEDFEKNYANMEGITIVDQGITYEEAKKMCNTYENNKMALTRKINEDTGNPIFASAIGEVIARRGLEE